MAKRALFDFVNGYEEPDSVGGRSITGKRFFSRSYSGSMTKQKQRIKSMRFFGFLGSLSRLISYTSTKVYGAASLTFGLSTLLLHFIKDYFGAYSSAPTSSLIIGIAFSIFAVPFLLFDRPISLFLQDFTVTDYIFFEFFCIKRTYRSDGEGSIPMAIAIICGGILALLGYFVPVWIIAAVIGVSVFVYISLLSPEFAFLASQLILPYLNYIPYSNIVFSSVIILCVLSFLRKSVSGKRVIFFEQYDLLIALLLLFIMISGIFVKGVESFSGAVIMLVMSLGYFLAGNIVTNRRLADRAIGALVISSVPTAFIAFGQLIYYAAVGNAAQALRAGLSSSFSAPDVFAVFLVVSITFTVTLIKQNRGAARIFYSAVIFVDSAALLLTGELFAVFSLLLGIAAYYALKARAWSALLLPLLFLVPYAVFLIPTSAKEAVFSILPTTLGAIDLMALWRTAFSLFRENLFIGIGIGGDSFAEEMAGQGIFGVADSNNLFLELGLEAGVFALVIFAFLLLVRLRHRATYYSYVKSSQVSTLAPIVSVSIFCLLCLGATDYIWSDASMFYLFWCVFGLGSATLRVAKKEHDDRILYYEDTRRTYSSSLDVQIR